MNFRPRFWILPAAVLLGACADTMPTDVPPETTAPALAVTAAEESFMPGAVIVRFRTGANAAAIAATQGVSIQRDLLLARTKVLRVPEGRELAVAAALARNPNVEFAEPDYMYAVIPCETGECADPETWFFGRKWDLHNSGTIRTSPTAAPVPGGTGDADIDWLEARHALGGELSGGAVIGIIDTGIRGTHIELAGKVIAAQNFAAGYPADLIADRHGHGTHVAGTAAASGAYDVPGVAWGPNVKLINAKACELYLNAAGEVVTSCPSSSVADAIVWATQQGAHVLNLSLGGSPAAATGSAAQQAALQYARANGTLPFCATGNDNYPGIAFPARFPECVAVGATNWHDARASYSNYGPQIELTAPGGDLGDGYPLTLILSMSAGSDVGYTYMAGTSMATPQVVGLAALLRATGVTDPDAIVNRMKQTADDLGTPGFDTQFGHGRINACRALDPANPGVQLPGTFQRSTTGVFPVVIFGNERFDISLLDAADVTLGTGTQSITVTLKDGEFRAALADVNLDGLLDLTLKFERTALAQIVSRSTTELTVTGNIGCRRISSSSRITVQ